MSMCYAKDRKGETIMMMGYGIGWGWMMLLNTIIPLVIIVAVVMFILSWLKKDNFTRKGGDLSNKAEEILRERFAKGEISVEEYERMKEVLRKK